MIAETELQEFSGFPQRIISKWIKSGDILPMDFKDGVALYDENEVLQAMCSR